MAPSGAGRIIPAGLWRENFHRQRAGKYFPILSPAPLEAEGQEGSRASLRASGLVYVTG